LPATSGTSRSICSAAEYELLQRLQEGGQPPASAQNAKLLERLRRFGMLV
jgi:hypothetical protein